MQNARDEYDLVRDQTYAILNATATVMAVMQSVELEILVVSSLLNRSGRIIDGVTLLLPQLSAIANVVETQATDTRHASDIARSVSNTISLRRRNVSSVMRQQDLTSRGTRVVLRTRS